MRHVFYITMALLALPLAGRAETRKLTLDEAVAEALARNPRMLAARARKDAAEAQSRSVRGRLLPSVRLSEEYQHYDKPFAIAFTIPGSPMAGPMFTARDQDTNTFVAVADQPLVGLLRLSQEYGATRDAAAAAGAQLDVSEAAVREGISLGVLRLFESRAMEEIARASAAELDEQVTVAEAKLKAGVLTNADVLRVRVAVANARQQEIVAHSEAEVARADLLGAIGRPQDDATIDFAEPAALLAEAARAVENMPQLGDAARAAVGRRPEVRLAQLQSSAAGKQARARLYGMLPEVDLEGAYVRIDGQAFAPKDSLYVGVRAQWPLWEWGASWYARQAAVAQAQATNLETQAAREQVGTEVASRLAQSRAATNAVGVAQAAIASAEEAYRVTNELVKAGSATTTDLLEVQAAMTQARLNLTRAKYGQAMARVRMRRALGE